MITGAILLALAGWLFAFGTTQGNFWIKIGIAVIIVCSYSLIFQRPRIRFSWFSLIAGIISAALLYAVFWVGYTISDWIVPKAHSMIGGVYSLGDEKPAWPIFISLFFITSAGEEIFWRGFLQEKITRRVGVLHGFWIAAILYGGVHIVSANLMLVLAATTAGAFWGLLYCWKRDLFLLIVSHSLWSAVIFILNPIGKIS